MTVALHIESYGETIVKRTLLRFEENVMVPRVALEAAATTMRAAVERQFDTEGGYASGGWAPLAPSTVAYKAAHDLDPHILRATDALKDSLTRKFDSRHIERIDPSGTSLTFGSTVPYGIFHQSSAPRTKLPYRPPVAITEVDKRLMVRGMQAAILEATTVGV